MHICWALKAPRERQYVPTLRCFRICLLLLNPFLSAAFCGQRKIDDKLWMKAKCNFKLNNTLRKWAMSEENKFSYDLDFMGSPASSSQPWPPIRITLGTLKLIVPAFPSRGSELVWSNVWAPGIYKLPGSPLGSHGENPSSSMSFALFLWPRNQFTKDCGSWDGGGRVGGWVSSSMETECISEDMCFVKCVRAGLYPGLGVTKFS